MELKEGDVLPEVGLATAVTARMVDTTFLRSRKVVVVVHGARSTEAPKEVAKAVRARWPSHEEVVLVSVVDLRPFGGLWKRVAEAQLKASYERLAAKAKEAGLPPEEHVLVCPDWEGTVAARLGAPNADQEPVAIVAGHDLRVRAVCKGPQMAEGVVAALAAD
ncbi:MAG: hypothetical protein QOD77_1372 [Thermoplasmata archaeon]|jgi:hypothetical protein|nr:hypothetical protein [Thermoplasmata archaeon]